MKAIFKAASHQRVFAWPDPHKIKCTVSGWGIRWAFSWPDCQTKRANLVSRIIGFRLETRYPDGSIINGYQSRNQARIKRTARTETIHENINALGINDPVLESLLAEIGDQFGKCNVDLVNSDNAQQLFSI